MGRIWMPGGGGGADLDVVTALAGDVLKGKVIVDADGNPLAGMLELTGDAADSHVFAGKTYYNTDAKTKRKGSMPNQGAVSQALNAGDSYMIPAGYHNGGGKVAANSLASQTGANAVAADILMGKTAWVNGSKVAGTMTEKAAATYTPGTANQVIAAGQYLAGAQTIKGDSNLVAGNICYGKSIFGVSGSAYKYFLVERAATYSGGYLTITDLGFTPTLISAVCAADYDYMCFSVGSDVDYVWQRGGRGSAAGSYVKLASRTSSLLKIPVINHPSSNIWSVKIAGYC